MPAENKEIEVRFLEINKEKLVKKLHEIGAVDKGEKMLEEIIIYDSKLEFPEKGHFVRLRKIGDKTKLTYKENRKQTINSAIEIELEVEDMEKAALIFEKVGLILFRRQQKKRHTFLIKDVVIDIDTWPRIPSYVELEGPSEDKLKEAAKLLGFDWNNAVFYDAKSIIEKNYNIPVGKMRWFTFDRFE